MNFSELNLHPGLLQTIREMGYTSPTPIQVAAIPHVMDGKDVMGCAQTGTGKTAAFALPIIQRLMARGRPTSHRRHIRVLALAPTRELAIQIGKSFEDYGVETGLRQTVVYGGVSQNPQTTALYRGVDILVATPGRLLDLMNQGFVDLSRTEVLVLDEADRMLDMGFIRDIRRIVAAVPTARQTLLFSATLPPAIVELGAGILNDPVSVAVTPPASTVERIAQSVFFVEKTKKIDLLIDLLSHNDITRALVFSRTKHGADSIVRKLSIASVEAAAIHGNKTQSNRQRALEAFRRGAARVLVATDIASRGLDIDEVSHVINFDLPDEPESYVHRIGRTGRAGLEGIALSFCSSDERHNLRDIERLIRKRLEVDPTHPFPSPVARQDDRPVRQDTRPARQDSRPARQDSRPARQDAAPARSPRPGAPTPNRGSRGPNSTRHERRRFAAA